MASSQCCENPPTLNSTSGSGCVELLGGLKAYTTGSLDSKLAVILISDVFGYESPKLEISNVGSFVVRGKECSFRCIFNNAPDLHMTLKTVFGVRGAPHDTQTVFGVPRGAPHRPLGYAHGTPLGKIADKVAAAGFFVVVPDFFYGDPYDPQNVEKPVPVWIKAHGPLDKGCEDSKPIIAELKSKGITAIGAAGFCWGAKVVVELGKSGDIQAAVLLHPSFVSVDDIKEVKVPISILGAEIDHLSPPALVKEFDEVLSTSGMDHFVKVFPGVSHGWTLRYDVGNDHVLKSAEEAHAEMLGWFTKYVK